MPKYKVRVSEIVRQVYELMVDAPDHNIAGEIVANRRGPLSQLSGAKAISEPVVVDGEIHDVQKVS